MYQSGGGIENRLKSTELILNDLERRFGTFGDVFSPKTLFFDTNYIKQLQATFVKVAAEFRE